jgi:hypothetical protein
MKGGDSRPTSESDSSSERLFRYANPAERLSTDWTEIYRPGTLKVSNIISPIHSRLSGVLTGLSVRRK